MSQTPPSLPTAPEFEREPAFLDTYANQLRINVSLSDVTLVFGVNQDLGHQNFAVRDKVAVHLAPTTAKILLAELQAVVEAYEKVVAPIPVPADLEAHVQAIRPELEAGLGPRFQAKKPAK